MEDRKKSSKKYLIVQLGTCQRDLGQDGNGLAILQHEFKIELEPGCLSKRNVRKLRDFIRLELKRLVRSAAAISDTQDQRTLAVTHERIDDVIHETPNKAPSSALKKRTNKERRALKSPFIKKHFFTQEESNAVLWGAKRFEGQSNRWEKTLNHYKVFNIGDAYLTSQQIKVWQYLNIMLL